MHTTSNSCDARVCNDCTEEWDLLRHSQLLCSGSFQHQTPGGLTLSPGRKAASKVKAHRLQHQTLSEKLSHIYTCDSTGALLTCNYVQLFRHVALQFLCMHNVALACHFAWAYFLNELGHAVHVLSDSGWITSEHRI